MTRRRVLASLVLGFVMLAAAAEAVVVVHTREYTCAQCRRSRTISQIDGWTAWEHEEPTPLSEFVAADVSLTHNHDWTPSPVSHLHDLWFVKQDMIARVPDEVSPIWVIPIDDQYAAYRACHDVLGVKSLMERCKEVDALWRSGKKEESWEAARQLQHDIRHAAPASSASSKVPAAIQGSATRTRPAWTFADYVDFAMWKCNLRAQEPDVVLIELIIDNVTVNQFPSGEEAAALLGGRQCL